MTQRKIPILWRGRPRLQGRESSRPFQSRLDSRLCKPGGLRHTLVRACCRLAVVAAVLAALAWPQAVEFAPVVSKAVSRTVDLPGEIRPFLAVSLHAKVAGLVDRVLVDRGSVVKQGDLLVTLAAPEIDAQIAEAESRFQASEADRLQAEAQLAAVESTAAGIAAAAKTPGAVAGNDLVQAQKQVEAAKALVNSRQRASAAARAAIDAQKAMQAYLRIAAPFAGVVTETVRASRRTGWPERRSAASDHSAGLAFARGCAGAGRGRERD